MARGQSRGLGLRGWARTCLWGRPAVSRLRKGSISLSEHRGSLPGTARAEIHLPLPTSGLQRTNEVLQSSSLKARRVARARLTLGPSRHSYSRSEVTVSHSLRRPWLGKGTGKEDRGERQGSAVFSEGKKNLPALLIPELGSEILCLDPLGHLSQLGAGLGLWKGSSSFITGPSLGVCCPLHRPVQRGSHEDILSTRRSRRGAAPVPADNSQRARATALEPIRHAEEPHCHSRVMGSLPKDLPGSSASQRWAPTQMCVCPSV